MLSDTLFRVPRAEGLQLLQRRGERGARELTTWRLRLSPGTSETYTMERRRNHPRAPQGRGVLEVGDTKWDVSRAERVHRARDRALPPPGARPAVDANDALEAVLVSTPAPDGAHAGAGVARRRCRQRPRPLQLHARSARYFRARPARQRLMVGETFNPAGNWSSFPPHKHDGRNGEPKLEEVYYFRIDPAQGFGHQVLYTNDGESVTHQVQRRRRGAPAIRLPSGVVIARLSPLLSVGDGG